MTVTKEEIDLTFDKLSSVAAKLENSSISSLCQFADAFQESNALQTILNNVINNVGIIKETTEHLNEHYTYIMGFETIRLLILHGLIIGADIGYELRESAIFKEFMNAELKKRES